ncbi:MAG: thioredoxin family protein [Sphingobacteriales bacterium]|jgi:thiol-disulfide isomerase/thioredoxin|nr:thioredoxin family protein [Sphingobacteriales bacterium]MBP9141159.1 thioredoxin family protein [Chitinophagales bacterium]MDA0198332.1 thioredoxin family protein [Bacteroidota bacterium]MBK6889552.1 thioredoxin family protein [Sphingobacteriales bacterium]MBK7527944.1 thioredoxin family protein [Sphingobacteriales bacterium]
MPALETTPIKLGFSAPYFALPNVVTGQVQNLETLKGQIATVIMFICNHCPYVKHINSGLVTLANEFIPKGIGFVAINSNDIVKYPDDSPQKMAQIALEHQYPFPYLFDETQQTARDYFAACTPDFSIFDADLYCVYRGQLDDSRPGNALPITGNDIRQVLQALLQGLPVSNVQKPSIGCSIKWK